MWSEENGTWNREKGVGVSGNFKMKDDMSRYKFNTHLVNCVNV